MKIKKIRGYVVYIFIITLLFFSCMTLKTHVGPSQIPAIQKSLQIENKFATGGRNFVFLVKEMTPVGIVPNDCQSTPILCQTFLGSSASGIVLSSDKHSITVLTAAHFCVKSEQEEMFEQKILGFANDMMRSLMILKLDEKNDLCLLMGAKNKADKFKDIKIADNFTIGEDVYAVAAPLGIAGPGLRLVFEGILSGCNSDGCITTIPATFGSSGAGIFNKKGELISIVMAVPDSFNHVVISPSNEALIKFIRDVDSEVDIYPY